MTAEEARIKSGLTLEQIAKKMHRDPNRVRFYELHGTFYRNALRLADIYRCPVETFLKRPA